MTTTDYLINIALVALVIIQVRGNRLTLATALRPVVLVAAAAAYYLKSVPTAGNDLLLDLVLAAIGLALGLACGFTTRVWRATDGFSYAKAGGAAAVLWVIGLGSRLAFEEFSSHGGSNAIANFSRAHDITSQSAWVAALVMMALAEVLARLVAIRVRAARTTETGEPLPVAARAAVAA